jgi:hypothetical protein
MSFVARCLQCNVSPNSRPSSRTGRPYRRSKLAADLAFQHGQVDPQEALHGPDGHLDAAVGLALADWRRDRGRTVGQALGDGVAQGLQRVLAVGAYEHPPTVAKLADAGDRAVDRFDKVCALVLEQPCSYGSGVAVAHHQERRHVLFVISAHEGVVERYLRDLTRHTLLATVWGGVLATLDALCAPRPER